MRDNGSVVEFTCLILGLKKVTDDMKTHKNPALRQGPKPFVAGGGAPKSVPASAPKAAPAVQKPPVTKLDGKKWIVVSWM